MLDEIELYITLNIERNLAQSDIDNINVRSPLEQRIQNQETKDTGWRFDGNTSLAKFFYKTTELNGSSYVKNIMRSSVILKSENCFPWSMLSTLHACEKRKQSFK